jgi:hypothetical protein
VRNAVNYNYYWWRRGGDDVVNGDERGLVDLRLTVL